MRIAWLRDHPWHVDALAAAHVEAFGALLPDWTLAQAADELRSHTRACAIPSTLLALDEQGDWLGSVSLLQEDHEHIRQYSPWLASLYVRPQARGRGLGKALLAHLAQRCVAEGLARLEWSVLDWNAPAIGFYDSLGAEAKTEWITRRLTGEALRRLAEGG